MYYEKITEKHNLKSKDIDQKSILKIVEIINNEDIFLLIQDIELNDYPRLHILDYSQSLEDELKQASSDLKNGKKTIGTIDKKFSNNDYGITFKKVEKNRRALRPVFPSFRRLIF